MRAPSLAGQRLADRQLAGAALRLVIDARRRRRLDWRGGSCARNGRGAGRRCHPHSVDDFARRWLVHVRAHRARATAALTAGGSLAARDFGCLLGALALTVEALLPWLRRASSARRADALLGEALSASWRASSGTVLRLAACDLLDLGFDLAASSSSLRACSSALLALRPLARGQGVMRRGSRLGGRLLRDLVQLGVGLADRFHLAAGARVRKVRFFFTSTARSWSGRAGSSASPEPPSIVFFSSSLPEEEFQLQRLAGSAFPAYPSYRS